VTDTRNKIYLIGFMGSGKSTVGRKLAKNLGWSFIDLDRKIEEHTGKTISDIFTQNGENFFRKEEAEILKDIKSIEKAVIATGGGAPCFGNNMDQMLEAGLTIYLRMTPSQLQHRLSGISESRPLISKLNKDQLLDFIVDKLEIRETWYNRAELIIDAATLDLNSLSVLIRKNLLI
jgi:shikimate kinase